MTRLQYWGESREITSAQKALTLNGVRYLPHYRIPGVFVGPGRPAPQFTEYELESRGAKPEKVLLWPRGYQS